MFLINLILWIGQLQIYESDIQVYNTNMQYSSYTKQIHREYSHYLSEEDKVLLATIVHAEAEGEPYMGKVLVAKVVLNRVKGDSWFGNTCREVIYKGNGSQFNAIRRKCFKSGIYTEEDMRAVEDAMKMKRYDDLLYFYNPKTSTDKAFTNSKNNDIILSIGGYVFTK